VEQPEVSKKKGLRMGGGGGGGGGGPHPGGAKRGAVGMLQT